MNRKELFQNIVKKKSFLCIGLDTDLKKIPDFLLTEQDPIFSFNKAIIDATADLTICYKPNTAFYEANGLKGWEALEKTLNYIKEKHPDIFVIADAKRGDIGNTSKMYAKAFFENMKFDAITVSPYMGKDSVEPFMAFPGKWIIVLALTSNIGSEDFQQISSNNEKLFETVVKKSSDWGSMDNMMYVVGATKAGKLKEIRRLIPDHFLLIPGVGAQGGSLEEVAQFGINNQCGLLVNVSRSVIYAGNDKNFDNIARQQALKIQIEMSKILEENNLYL